MGPKINFKKSTNGSLSRSQTPTTSLNAKSSVINSAEATPEKTGPLKKGRKRKNPLPDETPMSHGPGRPKKKKGDPSTPVPEPSTPISKAKSKKYTKKTSDGLPNGDPNTPSNVSSPRPPKEKKLTKKQIAAAKSTEKLVKPKKKYQKLTQEEREARRLQKKLATEEAKRLKQAKLKQNAKPKERPPVDVERQCGVPLENGGFCARSLTCKTHSMGAKRAVPGRSKPYDILLAAYQKRNQVKLAELSTQQQLDKENEEFSGAHPITEEEEISQVMSGVLESKPVPLEKRVMIPIRQKTKYFRMREMLITALNKTPPMASLVALSQSTSSNQSASQISNNNGQNSNIVAASTTANSDTPATNNNVDSKRAPDNSDASETPIIDHSRPAPPIPHNIGGIMNSTSALYGRALVFDALTSQTYTRPSQTLFASQILKHHNALRQRRLQQLQLEQQQQMHARALAQSQGVQMPIQNSLPDQLQQQRISGSPTLLNFSNTDSGMQQMVANSGFRPK